MLESIFEWILVKVFGYVWSVLVCYVLYPLGMTGLFIKEGIAGKEPSKLIMSVLGWIVAYGLIYHFLPLNIFLSSLFLLIAPIAGFFGYVIKPDFDI